MSERIEFEDRVNIIDAHSKVYCIIGNPVRHSMSPSVHNPSFAAYGINAVYVAFEMEDGAAAVRAMRTLGISGASVTIPHKLTVMPELDEIDKVARMIGAVNTIVNKDGKLIGLNTDGPGAVKAIKDAGVDLKGKKVTMIGSGGVARAVGFTLAANEALAGLSVIGIVKNELEKLVEQLNADTPIATTGIMIKENRDEAKNAVSAADIIVNATPIGMYPHVNDTPVPSDWISTDAVVFEVIYNPLETKLLIETAERGCKTIKGIEMFLCQAVLQFEHWTGEAAPQELMRRIVLEKLCGII